MPPILRLTFVLCLLSCVCRAGDIERILPEIPSNTIYYIYQDSKGFYWILTDNGICRYDGRDLEVFTKKDGAGDNENFQVQEDSQDRLWFRSYNGVVYYYSYKDNAFHTLPIQHPDSTKHYHVLCYYEDHNRDMWISFHKGGKTYRLPNGSNNVEVYELGRIHNVFGYGSKLLMLKREGIFEFKNKQLVPFMDFPNWKMSTFFWSCHPDSTTYLFSIFKNLYMVDLKHKTIDSLRFLDYVTGIQCQSDRIRVHTNSGTHVFDRKMKRQDMVLSNFNTLCSLQDLNNNTWYGTRKKGLYFNRAPLLNEVGEHGMEITCFEDNTRAIYYGQTTIHLGDEWLDPNLLGHLKKLWVDDLNTIAASHTTGIYWKRNGEERFIRISARDFVLHNDSTILIAWKGGLYMNHFSRLDQKEEIANDYWEHRIRLANEPNRIFSYGKKDQYLLATKAGLRLFDVKRAEERSLPGTHPLFNSYEATHINKLDSFYYIGTKSKGLFRINTEMDEKSIENYPIDHMVKKTAFGKNALYMLAGNKLFGKLGKASFTEIPVYQLGIEGVNDIIVENDTLFLATTQGMYYYQPHAQKLFTPVIQNIRANEQQWHVDQELVFEPKTNTIEIDFTSPTAPGANVYYQYTLLTTRSEDTTWTDISTGQVVLKSLEADDYEVLIRASTNHFEWKQAASVPVRFTLLPFFYQTWWFKLLIFSAVGGLVYLSFKRNILTYNREITRELLKTLLEKLRKQKFIEIKDVKDGGSTRIVLNDLMFAKADNKYVVFNMEQNKKVRCRTTLKEVKALIEQETDTFVQVHRSYVVNRQKMDAHHNAFVRFGEEKIPVGRAYKSHI